MARSSLAVVSTVQCSAVQQTGLAFHRLICDEMKIKKGEAKLVGRDRVSRGLTRGALVSRLSSNSIVPGIATSLRLSRPNLAGAELRSGINEFRRINWPSSSVSLYLAPSYDEPRAFIAPAQDQEVDSLVLMAENYVCSSSICFLEFKKEINWPPKPIIRRPNNNTLNSFFLW